MQVRHEPIRDDDIRQFGKYLGPRMRNRRMAERGTHAIVFWDGMSGGTPDMAIRMLCRGKHVQAVPCRRETKRTRQRAARSAGAQRAEAAAVPAIVSYRAKAAVTTSVTGTNDGRVRLRLGPTSTTTVEYPGAVGIQYALGLGLALANTVGNEGALSALVPPGWWVMLDTVTVSGSPTLSLVSNATIAGAQVEQLLA